MQFANVLFTNLTRTHTHIGFSISLIYHLLMVKIYKFILLLSESLFEKNTYRFYFFQQSKNILVICLYLF